MTERLLLGQVANEAAPASAAAELYLYSDGYGQSTGTDTPLLVETNDIALAGSGGRFLLRRILVPVRYGAACTVRITPITDFVRIETALSKSYAAPAQEQEDVIEVPIARTCNVYRVRIEVTARQGRVSVFAPTAVGQPLTTGAAMVVETA